MKIIDEFHQVSTVAERWKEQYFYGRQGWGTTVTGDTGAIYEKLKALPKTATDRDVAKIIGNDSWAGPSKCHECGETVLRTIELGEAPDYESHTAQICESCLRKALELLGAPQRSGES
jgi:hypothetical protein